MTPAEFGALALAVWNSGLDLNEKAVVTAMCSMRGTVGTQTLTVKVAYEDIARRAGLSRASVVRAVASLVARELVSRVAGMGGASVLVIHVALFLALQPAYPALCEPAHSEPPIGETTPNPAHSEPPPPPETEPPSPGPPTPAPAAASAGALAHVHAREVTEPDVIAEMIRRSGAVALTESGGAWLYRWQMRGHPAARLMHGLKTAATPAFLRADGCWTDEEAALRYANGAIKNAKPHEWQAGVEAPDDGRPMAVHTSGRYGQPEPAGQVQPPMTSTARQQSLAAIEDWHRNQAQKDGTHG